MSASMLLTNEAFRLKLHYNATTPPPLSSLCAARRDSAAFQMIVNADRYYCFAARPVEWYSSHYASHMDGTPLRLRASVDAPFPVDIHIEEFLTDDDQIRKADILLNQDVRESEAHVPSALWCEITVPEDALPGDYTITVKLLSSGYNDDETVIASEEVPLTVYPYVMPHCRDWKFHLDLWQHNSNIARKHDVPLWSDAHFQIIEKYAASLAALGQKTVMVCVSEIPWHGQGSFKGNMFSGNLFEYNIIGITREKDGRFTYDYSKLQKYIDICTEAGISGDIEMIGLVNVWFGAEPVSPLGTKILCEEHTEAIRLRYLDKADGCLKYMRDSEQIKDYIISLEKYFIQTGQIERVRVGADEPGNMEKYRRSLSLIREIAPSFRFKTAINHAEFIEEFGDVIDDFAPHLHCATQEYDVLMNYKKENPGKRFLWYVCCGGTRPNTFLRTDPIESRMIGPLTSAMRFDGFLRWNYTVWPDDPRKEIRLAPFEAGDTNFVYPAYNGDVLLSLRYKNLQRGIADYELFEKLRDTKGDEAADTLLAALLKTLDMAEYARLSDDRESEIFTRSWDDFNTVKARLLRQLS
ncbi:MAG: DUF4091 domain-containing protein [Ruminococcaceae bacterium]|nr:DUF4091 domain-containing protein [Oscillospiraceae bacterium]